MILVDFTDGSEAVLIHQPSGSLLQVCILTLLETSQLSLLDTLHKFICDTCLEAFVCIYIRT